MKKKYARGEIAKIILLSMVAAGMTVTFIALPGTAYIFKLFGTQNGTDRQRVRQSLKRLERKGFVRRCNKDQKEFFELTKKGKKEAHLRNIEEAFLKKEKKWDKKWTLVAFDIPENNKGGRQSLNRELRKLGFYSLQKSLYAYPYDCKKEIDFISEYFNIKKYIYYIKAETVFGKDKKLQKHFNV